MLLVVLVDDRQHHYDSLPMCDCSFLGFFAHTLSVASQDRVLVVPMAAAKSIIHICHCEVGCYVTSCRGQQSCYPTGSQRLEC